MKPLVFNSQVAFRSWLDGHDAEVGKLWVGFCKKQSGKSGITYPEVLAEAPVPD